MLMSCTPFFNAASKDCVLAGVLVPPLAQAFLCCTLNLDGSVVAAELPACSNEDLDSSGEGAEASAAPSPRGIPLSTRGVSLGKS